jgi:predicted hydrocarbon binding protein
MSVPFDFERYWLNKFADCLDGAVGREIREQVMEEIDGLSDESERVDVIAWTQGAMERLDALVEEDQRRAVMLGCACQYPKSDLQPMRQEYEASGDLDRAHQMLREQFESFLRSTLKLDEGMLADVIGRGWGTAGTRDGDTIIATKIPKSGYLVQYLGEADPKKRRQIYCHCPRVRDAPRLSQHLSLTYCYCGAGFYKGIWEEILQQPVEVELLESVLQGDEVCKFAIRLPL